MGRGVSFGRQSNEDSSVDDVFARLGLFLGRSEAMHQIAGMIRQVAAYPRTTVLLQGESGTGKDVVARAIHLLSSRAGYKFFPINCAAIPDTLLEAELFGVEAGAFTDAKFSRPGYLSLAHRGTLFLDEIGAMPLLLQPKLLRFLETHSFRRVGGTKEVHVDLRIISATNTDLLSAVAQGSFREDLFYRLKVITLYLAPLRERPEDIEPLVEYFLRVHKIEGKDNIRVSPEALELLLRFDWPGNVRQLRSVLQHGQIMCDGDVILPEHLPDWVRRGNTSARQRLQELQEQMSLPPEGIDLPGFLSSIEGRFVREALERCHGNQVRAAMLLGISRDQLRYRLAELLKSGDLVKLPASRA